MNAKSFNDQLGNRVEISFPPQRIISLVPSQTELLADLGLGDRVVGITKFCVHPEEWRRSRTIIGGTKKFDLAIIQSLNPDLIIGNKEENYEEGIEKLLEQYPVWMSDIVTLDEACKMILQVGEITGTERKAVALEKRIKADVVSIVKFEPRRTLYLIWKDPWMGAGSGTFIDEMLKLSGLQNCLKSKKRYPELAAADIEQLNPELILLSSEPFPFREKHIEELQQLCPDAKILLVDGEVFSWYGSRLLKFPAYLENLRIALS